MTPRGTWGLLGVLGLLVAATMPELGSDAWPFETADVEPRGVLGPLVRAAGEEWDVGVLRAAAVLAGLVVAAAAAVALRVPSWSRGAAITLTAVVVGLLAVPATLLQLGLRDATEPWLHTNDSTYQIELAGDLVLDGDTPYGNDYRGSGLERWYPAVGLPPLPPLDHLPYFPGTPLSGAAWNLLPAPFDDYRLLVLLATLALLPAALLFPAPLGWQLAAGAALAANPLATRAAWFGTADATSVLCVVLAFAFALRARYGTTAVLLAVAVLLKQFALVAVPFLVALLVLQRVPRRTLWRNAALGSLVVLAGALPFAIADPGALWSDTITYSSRTYRIIGYGLAGLLVEAGVIERDGSYPFALLAALIWAPLTAYLVWAHLRSRAAWTAAAGFAISIFVLFYLARLFQTTYLIWPLSGIVLAALLAAGGRDLTTTRARDERRPTETNSV